MWKNLDEFLILNLEKTACTLVRVEGDGLPDLRPWLDNESDLYEELPSQSEYPYD
jgi:hypothetical protein